MKTTSIDIVGLGLSCLFSLVSCDYIQTHNIPDELNGSNFTYPWPVNLYHFTTQHNQTLEMAFMDVPPACGTSNGKTAVLLHGKNFCGPTWGATASVLADAGYRVILPDQVGYCKSSKPASYQFSLQQLAENTLGLLNTLGGIDGFTLIGHSLGGMLATRFALMHPDNITKLVLTNPIGLEDWKAKGVPYISTDISWATEQASNYTSIRGYEQSTYYVNTWSPAYDTWVNMLLAIYTGPESLKFTWNQALVIDMVLTQPIAYEFPLLKPKTLLLIGANDTTAIGKPWSPPAVQATLGHYNVLGPQVAALIPESTLVVFPGLGHAPMLQAPDRYHAALMGWLAGNLTAKTSTG